MSFWRHEEIYRSDVGLGEARNGNGCRRSPHSSAAMSFQSAIPQQVALQQCLPLLHRLQTILNNQCCRTMILQRTATTPLTPCLSSRVHSTSTLSFLCGLREIFGPPHLADFGFAFPAGPVLFVKFHEADRRVDGLLLCLELKLGIATDDFLGFGERPVGHGHLSSRKPDAGAQRGWPESAASNHVAGFGRVFAELRHGIHQRLGWGAGPLGGLDYHHESHIQISFISFGLGAWLPAVSRPAEPGLGLCLYYYLDVE